MKLLKNDIYNVRYVLFILIIYFIVMQYFFDTICIFKAVTHIDCPGCGLTRGCFYLLTFNFSKSWNYNRCSIFWIITIFIFIIDRYIYHFKIKNIPIILAIISSILTIINYVLEIYNLY